MTWTVLVVAVSIQARANLNFTVSSLCSSLKMSAEIEPWSHEMVNSHGSEEEDHGVGEGDGGGGGSG